MTYYSNAGLQTYRSRKLFLIAAAVIVGVSLALTVVLKPASALSTVAKYDSIPSPLPASTPSEGFQATQTAELGAKIQFSAGERKFDSADVVLNSWACQSGNWENSNCVTTPGATFQHDVTLNIYAVLGDGSKGALLKTVTQTFDIPYRPSTATPGDCPFSTQWKSTAGTCQNGLNVPVTFNLGGVTLPDQVIYGVAYNTQSWGYAPLGVDGPYNSLNVAVVDPVTGVHTGSSLETFVARGASPIFQADASYSTETPAVRFNAVSNTPLAQDDCKNGGYLSYGFKNQGLCVAKVQSSEKSKLNR